MSVKKNVEKDEQENEWTPSDIIKIKRYRNAIGALDRFKDTYIGKSMPNSSTNQQGARELEKIYSSALRLSLNMKIELQKLEQL